MVINNVEVIEKIQEEITFSILFSTFHHIDITNNRTDKREIKSKDLTTYIETTIKNVIDTEDSKLFNTTSDNTEVVSSVLALATEENSKIVEELTDGIATRLLLKEIEAQEKYRGITVIKKGSLIQSLIKLSDEFVYLIAKVEHEDYLNTDQLIREIGLPYNKKALKICAFRITDNDIIEIVVKDTNSKISRYWYEDFLEVKEVNGDEYNTRTSFTAIDSILSSKLKKSSPVDYTILRNTVLGYYKSNDSFSFDRLVESVFNNYEPESEDIDFTSIKRDILKSPEKQKFDRMFEIIPTEIKSRIRKVYKVNDNIEINIMGYIESLKDIISSEEINGQKFIKIKTQDEKLFEAFKYSRWRCEIWNLLTIFSNFLHLTIR